MRLLVQRVKEASVTIGGTLRARIGAGLLVLIGVGLPLAYFAVWIFVRGAVGFVNLVIRKGGDWCYDHGEVTG